MILSAHGSVIPEDRLGTLVATDPHTADGDTLRRQLDEHGYLYLPHALPRDDVLRARHTVMERLVDVGEIREENGHAISTGTSIRAEKVKDLGKFWQDLCELPDLRNVTHAGNIVSIMNTIFNEAVRSFDFLWLRAMHPGRASAYHFDHVYMNRGTDRLLTCWTPLGDVELDEGPLAMVEGSHRWKDLIAQFQGFDVDVDKSRPGHVTLDPVSLIQERDTRLLTSAFAAGDVVIFPMFTLHGSLDNASTQGRVRFSADTRFQPAADPVDERWVGENPLAHGGGYAAMSGAQPATSNPIHR